jgi:hypothetical protein
MEKSLAVENEHGPNRRFLLDLKKKEHQKKPTSFTSIPEVTEAFLTVDSDLVSIEFALG